MKKEYFVLLMFALILNMYSCKKDDPAQPSEPSVAEIVSGDGQIAIKETTLTNPVVILVKDQFGKPFQGAVVKFSVTEGNVSENNITTNSAGQASVYWTLGSSVGSQTLSVNVFKKDEATPVNSSPVIINATATQELPEADVIEIVAGNEQSAIVGEILPNSIELIIKDQFGEPFEGAAVNFTITEGSLSELTSTTDINGKINFEWTLGVTAGVQTITATAFKQDGTTPLTGSPLNITATANPLAPTSIELVSGNNQTEVVLETLPNPLVVLVKDQNGDIFAGADVTFSTTDGTVSEATVETDINGNARVIWTLGGNTGSQALTASIDGSAITFNATGTKITVTDYDNNTYDAVVIGNQVWMAENLKVTHYSDGRAIPTVIDINANGTNDEWAALGDNNTDKAYCYYDTPGNSSGEIYGALYTYAAASDGNSTGTTQGACPTGWHVPSDAEWTSLISFLGESSGSKLAGNKSLWYSGPLTDDPNFGSSGFDALPGGIRFDNDGHFQSIKTSGYFWSATQNMSSTTWVRETFGSQVDARRYTVGKSYGLSIRCVRD